MNWEKALEELEDNLPDGCLSIERQRIREHASDMTEDFVFEPIAVLTPENTEQTSLICKICNEYNVPIHARGAGTSLSGGSLATAGGICLSMTKMNKILEIDRENLQATVEPGVINENLRIEAAKYELTYAVDPASKGSCSMGGNVAHNSGGPRALKYGVTSQNVLNLELVLADGSIIWTGADTLKNSTGYSLTQLIIGSEGTLGIVTKIVVKLISLPKYTKLLFAGFRAAQNACKTVTELMKMAQIPSAIELMENKGLLLSSAETQIALPFINNYAFYLLIETDGDDEENLMLHCEKIAVKMEKLADTEICFADTSETKEKWWKLRRVIGEVVKNHSIFKEQDIVVKRAYLHEVFAELDKLKSEFGFESISYGHAGDGNLHINILKEKMTDEQWNGEHLKSAIRKLFFKVKELGGTISGEHGVGYVQKTYLDVVIPEFQIELLRKIKLVFDPKGILNPGKIFDL